VQSYKIANMVADIKELIKALNDDKPCYLAAHDWGGVIAWFVGAIGSCDAACGAHSVDAGRLRRRIPS
jgi:alpha-beta hydrolase superfamily lysophospholipase